MAGDQQQAVRDRARRQGDLRAVLRAASIPNGTSQISGNFTEASAKSLATSLKYGALPITFDQTKTTIQVIGPSLAGDQL